MTKVEQWRDTQFSTRQSPYPMPGGMPKRSRCCAKSRQLAIPRV
ncbi:MAG: hypothetical protein ACJ8E4_06085 [Sphingomicrobium sp.]